MTDKLIGPVRASFFQKHFGFRFLDRLVVQFSLGTVLLGLIPLVALLIWLRVFGLPTPCKIYLLTEVEKHHILPYPIEIDKLLLDPTGAVLAKGLTVFRDASKQRILLQVDQVRIGIAWLGWWRGHGFIDRASISNAEVLLPIHGQTSLDFQQVNADFTFDGHDIRVENAQAHLLNIALYLRGTIHNEGLAKSSPPTEEQLLSREQALLTWQETMKQIGSDSPIEAQLEFEASTKNLAGGLANFDLEAHHFTWRNAAIQEAVIHASLRDGAVSLNDFHIDLSRGELTAYGEYNFAEKKALLQFNSNLDFTEFSPACTGIAQRALQRLDFPDAPPSISGRILMNLEHGFKSDVQADLDWSNFTFNGRAFSHLTIPLAYDGQRLLIPGLTLQGDAGSIDLKLFLDKTKDVPNLQSKLTSSLDPTVLKGIFGLGFDNFLNSCEFKAGGPNLNITITGSDLKTTAWVAKGKLNAEQFSYKSAAFLSAVSDFTFADAKLSLPNLQLHRPEGNASGSLVYDFANRQVSLKDFVAEMTVQQVAPVMGPKFTEYTQPYHFVSPPTVRANGLIDLQSEKKELDTDLMVNLQAHSAMQWTLFGVPYTYKNPEGTLLFKNRRLLINLAQAGYYEGALTGQIDLNLRNSPATFDLNLDFEKVNFQKFMVQTFSYKDSLGLMNLQTHLTGSLGPMDTLAGTGEIKISDGDIATIPFLGALTPLIPGFSTADAAHGHFTVNRGQVQSDDLSISSETFALIGSGKYNFVEDNLDLDMRVNVNGPFGIILYPVSKIFEYHGYGPMKNPKWVPKNF